MEKAIKDFPNYTIDDNGRVKNIHTGKFLKILTNKQTSYYQVSLWKNNKGTWKYIHRLLAEHFIPNPLNLPEVNHIDGNRQNNALSNLEWVTGQQNKIHAIQTGLRKYTNRLTELEFIQLLNRVIAGESYLAISKTVNYKVPFLSVKLRSIARKYGREEQLNSALKHQKYLRSHKQSSTTIPYGSTPK